MEARHLQGKFTIQPVSWDSIYFSNIISDSNKTKQWVHLDASVSLEDHPEVPTDSHAFSLKLLAAGRPTSEIHGVCVHRGVKVLPGGIGN